MDDDEDAPAKRRPWGLEEDEQLRKLVDLYGINSWAAIATNLSNRSGKQCRERWRNHLRPKPNKGDPLAHASPLIGHYGAVEYATKYATKGSNPEEFLGSRSPRVTPADMWWMPCSSATGICRAKEHAQGYCSGIALGPLFASPAVAWRHRHVPPRDGRQWRQRRQQRPAAAAAASSGNSGSGGSGGPGGDREAREEGEAHVAARTGMNE